MPGGFLITKQVRNLFLDYPIGTFSLFICTKVNESSSPQSSIKYSFKNQVAIVFVRWFQVINTTWADRFVLILWNILKLWLFLKKSQTQTYRASGIFIVLTNFDRILSNLGMNCFVIDCYWKSWKGCVIWESFVSKMN